MNKIKYVKIEFDKIVDIKYVNRSPNILILLGFPFFYFLSNPDYRWTKLSIYQGILFGFDFYNTTFITGYHNAISFMIFIINVILCVQHYKYIEENLIKHGYIIKGE